MKHNKNIGSLKYAVLFPTQRTSDCSQATRPYIKLPNVGIVCSLIKGENVEENAYVVLRLLIRRPECFGPALRGDGGKGLLAAMEDAIRMSEDPSTDGPCTTSQSVIFNTKSL